MPYLQVHYISKKLKQSFAGLTTVLIDSEVEDYYNNILTSTLNNKGDKVEYPLTVGIQQELVLQCFLYLLSTNFKNYLNIYDVHFYVDNVQIKFDYNNPWKVMLNIEDFKQSYKKISYYNKFVMSTNLSN